MNDISSDSDEEIDRILENKDPKNTERCTKNAILAFHASLKIVENAEKVIKIFWQSEKERRQKVQGKCTSDSTKWP